MADAVKGDDMDQRTDVPTVRAFLDAELSPSRRTHHLDDLATQVVAQPVDSIVASLREAVAARIDLEDYRRLHVLISCLYHACGTDMPLIVCLRDEVNTALSRTITPAIEGR